MCSEVDSRREVVGEGVHVGVVDSNRVGIGGDEEEVAYVHKLLAVEDAGMANVQGERSCGYWFDVLLAFHLEKVQARKKMISYHVFDCCRCYRKKKSL